MFDPLLMFCCRSTSVTIMDVFTEIGHEIWVATTTGEQATPSGIPPPPIAVLSPAEHDVTVI